MCRAEQRLVLQAQHPAAFKDIFARQGDGIPRCSWFAEIPALDHFAEKMIGFQQDVIFKENVVDADNAFFPQNTVVQIMQAAPHLETNAEMRIVVQIRAGRNDPVDKPGTHQWNDCGHAEAGRSHRTGKAHADSDIVRQHAFGEELAGFAKARGIVGVEGLIDQIGNGDIGVDRRGLNRLSVEKAAFLVHRQIF